MTYIPPQFRTGAFTCPLCEAHAHMRWSSLYRKEFGGGNTLTAVQLATCAHCDHPSVWLAKGNDDVGEPVGIMIYPRETSAPAAHPSMPAEVRTDYEEARSVLGESPRAAAALLRLAIQKLCIHLGGAGENLNKDIGKLVRDGLPIEIQQALDIVRVIGNHAVHPGELSDDVPAVANALFELVNQVVEDRIARPAKLAKLYESLPDGAREHIDKRDAK